MSFTIMIKYFSVAYIQKYIGHIIAIIGFALFAYSFNLEPYTNSEAYYKAYSAMEEDHLSLSRNEDFDDLRRQFLTNKYKFQDYGMTFFSLGLFLAFLTRNGWNKISAPDKKGSIASLGFAAVFLTSFWITVFMYSDMYREELPSWTNDIGVAGFIVQMALSYCFIVLLLWAVIHMFGLKGNFIAGASINCLRFKNINWWYAILTILTTLIIIVCIYHGNFWLAFPGLLWLYFYVSILAGRSAAKASNKTTMNTSN